jgi:hypothetical protein
MEKRPRDRSAKLAAMTAIKSVTLEAPDASAAPPQSVALGAVGSPGRKQMRSRD